MIAQGDARGLLEVARDIFNEGQDLKQFCLALIGFFRDLLVAGVVEDASDLLNRTPEEAREFQALARQVGREKLYRCFRMAMDVERDVRHATSPQPVLEMSLMRMADLRASASLGAVFEKLRAVEAAIGLAEGGASGPESSAKMTSRPRGSGEPLPESGLTPVVREDRQIRPPQGPGPSSPVETGVTKVATPQKGGTAEPDADDQQGLWQRLLQEVGGLKQIVVHYLENGRLVSVGKGQVEIGVAGYDLQLAKENQQVIMEAVRRIWGEGKRVHLVPVSPPVAAETPDSVPANGAPSDRPPENVRTDEDRGTNSIKFMEELFRDADEIFGDAGPPPAAGAV
jgi:DNA polymerase III gamma/tau subunit